MRDTIRNHDPHSIQHTCASTLLRCLRVAQYDFGTRRNFVYKILIALTFTIDVSIPGDLRVVDLVHLRNDVATDRFGAQEAGSWAGLVDTVIDFGNKKRMGEGDGITRDVVLAFWPEDVAQTVVSKMKEPFRPDDGAGIDQDRDVVMPGAQRTDDGALTAEIWDGCWGAKMYSGQRFILSATLDACIFVLTPLRPFSYLRSSTERCKAPPVDWLTQTHPEYGRPFAILITHPLTPTTTTTLGLVVGRRLWVPSIIPCTQPQLCS